jgi:hypothetical protein
MTFAGGRAAMSAGTVSRREVKVRSQSKFRVDASGYMIFPGLINAHDHLEFNLYPRLGRGPYANSKAWSEDIYFPDREPIRTQLCVPKRVRLVWGGIKNLVSGATTVCHHNCRDDATLDDNFPVRVVKKFGWAHSLDFSRDVMERYRATPRSWPFILHLGEGTDDHGREEIFRLHEMGALGDRTVLVHGVGLTGKGLALARSCGTALIWCPTSNLFMLGRTLTASVLRGGMRVALGSDSALTADGDLLDELRAGRRSARVDSEMLYRMVTDGARAVLRLGETPGDVVLFRDAGLGPAETLLNGGWPELVVVGGRIRLAAAGFAERLPMRVVERMFRLCVDGREMLCDIDVGALWRKTAAILGPEFRVAGKRITA